MYIQLQLLALLFTFIAPSTSTASGPLVTEGTLNSQHYYFLSGVTGNGILAEDYSFSVTFNSASPANQAPTDSPEKSFTAICTGTNNTAYKACTDSSVSSRKLWKEDHTLTIQVEHDVWQGQITMDGDTEETWGVGPLQMVATVQQLAVIPVPTKRAPRREEEVAVFKRSGVVGSGGEALGAGNTVAGEMEERSEAQRNKRMWIA